MEVFLGCTRTNNESKISVQAYLGKHLDRLDWLIRISFLTEREKAGKLITV